MPEIVGSTFMALIGFGFGAAGLYLYDKKNVDQRKYKFFYTGEKISFNLLGFRLLYNL